MALVGHGGRRSRRGGGGSSIWGLLSVPILAMLALPIIIVIPMAFTSSSLLEFPPPGFSLRWMRQVVTDSEWMGALATSMKVAGTAVLIGCVGGTAAALGLRKAKGPFATGASAVMMAPLVIPIIVLAFADYQLFAQLGLLGNWVSLGIAHGVLGTPFAFVLVRASLNAFDPALLRSAQSLGAGFGMTARHVYWPVIRSGVFGAAAVVFAFSFDEAVIALFLQGPGAITVPVKMFTDIQYSLSPDIAAMAALVLLVTLAVIVFEVAVGSSRAGALGLRSRSKIGGS